MWYGKPDAVPYGWVICNGSHDSRFGGNVPNLMDRFVVGAGKEYSLGAQGGAASVTLEESQMPRHSHSGKVHEQNLNNNGGGDYKLMAPGAYGRGFKDGGWAGYDRGAGGDERHLRDCMLLDHDHELSIEHSGEGKAHENRPPYFALYYIIKVADEIE